MRETNSELHFYMAETSFKRAFLFLKIRHFTVMNLFRLQRLE